MFNFGDTDSFYFDTEEVLEFLDVMDMQTHKNIVQRVRISPFHLFILR